MRNITHWVILGLVAVGGWLACGDPGRGGDEGGYPISENATCKHEGDYATVNEDGVAKGLECTKSSGNLRWKRVR